jgi:cob(I)alamin adenosyltransferase
MEWGRGYVQLYIGEGKGKTTAALGLTIRAIGAGLKVAFFQFFKPPTSSEVKILKSFYPQVLYQNFHAGGFVMGNLSQELIEEIRRGWKRALEVAKKREYQVLVLDELTYALNWGIINEDELISFLQKKPTSLEVVITGRYVPQSLIDEADLVTEMKLIKHYFNCGVSARLGIEK